MDATLAAILTALYAAHQEVAQLRARVEELTQALAAAQVQVQAQVPAPRRLAPKRR